MTNYTTLNDAELNALCLVHDITADNLDEIVLNVEVEIRIEADSNFDRVVFFGGSRIETFSYEEEEKATNFMLSFLTERQKVALEVNNRK